MAQTKEGIYYPNDYASKADVPNDMKKMAESIGKVIKENAYDDTDIKKDLEDIKEEQETQNTDISNLKEDNTKQDELITKLQEENNKLKSALINVETEEEKNIHIEDASQIGSLEVLGNHEQDGEPSPENEVPVVCLGSNKNELDIDNCTVEKGSINTDGTFTNSSNRIRVYNINLKSNKTYTISTSNKNLNVVPYFYKEEEFISYLNGWKEFPYTFTMPDNANNLKLLFRNNSDSNIEINDILNAHIKIEEGTEATSYSPFRTR